VNPLIQSLETWTVVLQIIEGSSTFAGYIAAKLVEAVDRRP
jgi:hypothetical protein